MQPLIVRSDPINSRSKGSPTIKGGLCIWTLSLGGGAATRMVHVLMAIFLSVVATENGKVGPQKYPKQSTGVCVCMLTRFLWASLKESVVKATNKRPRLEILERSEEETGTLTNWTRGSGSSLCGSPHLQKELNPFSFSLIFQKDIKLL